jgi:predicted MarR family transcription regulator
MRLSIELFELLVQLLKALAEVMVRFASFRDAHIPARIEAPALGLDLVDRCHLAEAGHIGVSAVEAVLGQQ